MAAKADTALDALEAAVARADSLMAGLQRGQGSAGLMMQDEQLYRELTETIAEARRLIADVMADPKKYFKVSVF
jgi:phospholipid/cholesterol/gamma-HCH transport system substrate-binding protein